MRPRIPFARHCRPVGPRTIPAVCTPGSRSRVRQAPITKSRGGYHETRCRPILRRSSARSLFCGILSATRPALRRIGSKRGLHGHDLGDRNARRRNYADRDPDHRGRAHHRPDGHNRGGPATGTNRAGDQPAATTHRDRGSHSHGTYSFADADDTGSHSDSRPQVGTKRPECHRRRSASIDSNQE